LLLQHPELKNKVKMLALTHPTRDNLKEYQEYLKEVKEQVKKINQQFGNISWQPVKLVIKDDYWLSLAAMQLYDVLLINPLFDGMNLVAKEAAALNKTDGVMVLSENAGAYEEIRDAVLGINPFDLNETAAKLYQALTMPPLERKVRAERLKEIVAKNDVLKWLYYQISDLCRGQTLSPQLR
jgi:trehalose 6-phosphate synthase